MGPGAWSRVAATREELIDDIRETISDHHEERALQPAFIATFANFGWNKALDAAENPGPVIRAREAADLAWWVDRARAALETWSPV